MFSKTVLSNKCNKFKKKVKAEAKIVEKLIRAQVQIYYYE
jgi:hypothetical protein